MNVHRQKNVDDFDHNCTKSRYEHQKVKITLSVRYNAKLHWIWENNSDVYIELGLESGKIFTKSEFCNHFLMKDYAIELFTEYCNKLLKRFENFSLHASIQKWNLYIVHGSAEDSCHLMSSK